MSESDFTLSVVVRGPTEGHLEAGARGRRLRGLPDVFAGRDSGMEGEKQQIIEGKYESRPMRRVSTPVQAMVVVAMGRIVQ
eukprot:1262859-Amorphochlora_amoeboformis.AAC.1